MRLQISLAIADLVASYILDNAKNLFTNTTSHYGIYRDDVIIFLKDIWTSKVIFKWVKTFQIRVGDLLDITDLKFTTKIWNHSKGTLKLQQ